MKIRESTAEDAGPYQELCYEVNRDTYVNQEIGFDENLISREIFFNEETTKYFTDQMTPKRGKHSFVAVAGNGSLLGGIVVNDNEVDCLVGGFYVRRGMHGKGIGRELWQKAEEKIKGRTTKLTVNAHAWRSVNAYFKKGFIIDPSNPLTINHWPEWPADKRFLMYCMIRSSNKTGNTISSQTKKNTNILKAKLYADGASRGNPGPSSGGYAILDMADNVVKKNGKYLGITTNNQAEYHSLKGGLEMAIQMGIRDLDVYMDSLLVVNQMKGIYKIRNRDLWPIHDAIKSLLPKFKKINFTHIPRELNKLADAVANEALDAQNS